MSMTVNTKTGLSGQSALQAYRADLPRGGAEPTAYDGDAILVATLVRQSLSGGHDVGERIRAEAIAMAKRSLGAPALLAGCTYDDHAAESDVDVMRLLAQRTAQSGWLCLSQHLLESTTEFATDPIDCGRLLADRARNSRKQGRLDLSEEQTLELMRRGKRLSSTYLIALAHDMLGGLAQTRGNFVELAKHAEESVRLSQEWGFRRLLASGYGGLGVRAGMSGQYGEAVVYFWSSYHTAGESGVTASASLGNLAQILLLSGRPADARKIATLVLHSRPPIQNALPLLGGYAVASARVGDREGVEWACNQVRHLARSPHYAREIAGALLECATGLEEIGRHPQASVLRRRAESIATDFGFHDLTFSEALVAGSGAPPARQEFVGAAARAAAEIAELEVSRIASNFELAFA